MKYKRGFLSIFLILIILVITGRFLLFISYISSQKTVFRNELIKHSIAEAKTIQVRTNDLFKNTAGFVWKENNKELVINGVYHEVVCVKKNGGTTLVTILEDREENRLFCAFFSNNKNRSSFITDFIKILSSLTFLNQPTFHLNTFIAGLKVFHVPDCKTLHDFHSRLMKPPKFF